MKPSNTGAISNNIQSARTAIMEVLKKSHDDLLREINAAICRLPQRDMANINTPMPISYQSMPTSSSPNSVPARTHGCTVTFKERAIAAWKKYHSYFYLVSNCEKDTFDCLGKYRRRETPGFFFASGKQRADGDRTRVWSSGSYGQDVRTVCWPVLLRISERTDPTDEAVPRSRDRRAITRYKRHT